MKIDDDSEDYDYDLSDSNVTVKPKFFHKDEVNATAYHITDLDSYTNYSIHVCSKTTAGVGNCTETITIQTIAGSELQLISLLEIKMLVTFSKMLNTHR